MTRITSAPTPILIPRLDINNTGQVDRVVEVRITSVTAVLTTDAWNAKLFCNSTC